MHACALWLGRVPHPRLRPHLAGRSLAQVSVGAMLPITSVQFGMNRLLEQTYKRVFNTEQLGTGGMIGVAMGAGATSALLGCPAE